MIRHRKAAIILIVATLFNGFTEASRHKHYHRVPIINLSGAEELIGTINEDDRVVAVSPHLHILPETGPICRYELSSVEDGKDLPFESVVNDKVQGTAQIRLKGGAQIDCSTPEYKVRIAAVRCADDSAKSEFVTMKISVQDTNNHAPEFEAPWYSFDVEEGKVGEISRLYATDKDCGHPYGKICRYEITNTLEGSPFSIDDQGILSATRPLNRSHSGAHILTVVAHDCGALRSKSTLVTVHVQPKCVDGLRTNGEEKKLQYELGAGGKKLVPEAEIFLCAREKTCTVKSAEASVTLEDPEHRDYPLETTKKCGLKQETLNLLPRSGQKSASEEEAEQKYLFDGKSNAIIVPSSTVQKTIPETFTLSFSMKHERGSKQQQAIKQNLLCESDDFGMNRHHLGVYLRHCKLELLLRREADKAEAEAEFRAAEWRWDTPEVCDGQWHSYAILFTDLDNVTLMVDGVKFEANDRNPEILDDWPLHQTKQHKMKLVVGACWHGRNQAMVQFFDGYLSSMYLLPGAVEPESDIECLHKNHERLRFDSINQLVPGESAIFNKEMTHLSLKANTLEDLSLLLSKVEYSCKRKAPIEAGQRKFKIESRVDCVENQTIPLGVYRSAIEVSKPVAPQVSISGQNLITVDRRSLKEGAAMLPDVQITITQSNDREDMDVTAKHKLDWCKVHLKPSRDMDLEYFSSPAALLTSMNIEFEHDKQGILLKGKEGAGAYNKVLSKIHYFNTRPDSYNKRIYTVQCALNEGKVVSNEFIVTMTITDDSDLEETIDKLSVVSKKLEPSSENIEDAAVAARFEKHFEPAFDQLGANRLQNILEMDLPRPKALLSHHGYEVGQGAVAGGAVAIVVVICIGFLLVLLLIGVVKMRDNPLPRRRRSRKPTMEGMEWDNDGLNITVNPLEDVEKIRRPIESPSYSDDEDEESSEDGNESYREEDELTEDDEDDAQAQILPLAESSRQLGLEWDDTDSAAALPSTSSKSYRV